MGETEAGPPSPRPTPVPSPGGGSGAVWEPSLLPAWRRGGWSERGDWTSLEAARAARKEEAGIRRGQAQGREEGVCYREKDKWVSATRKGGA